MSAYTSLGVKVSTAKRASRLKRSMKARTTTELVERAFDALEAVEKARREAGGGRLLVERVESDGKGGRSVVHVEVGVL